MLGRAVAGKSHHARDVYEYLHPVQWQKLSPEASGFCTVKPANKKNPTEINLNIPHCLLLLKPAFLIEVCLTWS